MENVKELEDLLIAKLLLVLATTAIFGYRLHNTIEHILLYDGTGGFKDWSNKIKDLMNDLHIYG
jgi:hypothetical protein